MSEVRSQRRLCCSCMATYVGQSIIKVIMNNRCDFFIVLKVLAVHTNLQLRKIFCTLKVHLQIRNCGARDQQEYSALHKITDYAPEVRSRNEIRQWKPGIKGLLITQSVSKLVSQNAFEF